MVYNDGRIRPGAAPRRNWLLFIAFTTIFCAYFLVWLPGPAAGLQFIGLEMGEWTKFLGVDTRRNWFYLPPLTLALMLIFLAPAAPRRRLLQRLFAMGISLLAFPALEDITGPLRHEYTARVFGILMVFLIAVGVSGWERWSGKQLPEQWIWAVVGLLGLVGVLLPTWIFLLVRPVAAQVMAQPLSIGIGVWLNGLGHLLVCGLAGFALWRGRRP